MRVIERFLQESGRVCLLAMLMLVANAPAHASSVASLSSPPDGATNVDTLTTFSWNSVPDALAYFVYVGSARGLSDVYGSGEITTTTVTITLQPQTHYFVRLWTKKSSGWSFTDTTFTTGTGISHLLSPQDGASNVDPHTSLSWSAVTDAQAYFVYVGSAPGLMDVYGSGETLSTTIATSTLQPNTRYFVRMWTKKKEGWHFADTTFSTGTGIAHLITPQDGASNVDPVSRLSWSAVTDALAYFVYVGSAPGLMDVYGSGETPSTNIAPANLQPNTHYFVRMWTKKNEGWYFADTTFSTGTGIARLITPQDGALNVDPFSKLAWNTVADAQAYYVYLGSAQGLADVYGSGEITSTSIGISNLQPATHYFVRLWTKKASGWSFSDSAFTTGIGIAEMVYPADKATGVDPGLPFKWSIDPQAAGYELYVGTTPGSHDVYDSGVTTDTSSQVPISAPAKYYVRLFTVRSGETRYVDSSFIEGDFISHLITPPDQGIADPYANFVWTSVPNVTSYFLYVGTSVGALDVFGSNETKSTSIFVPNLKEGTRYYARMWTFRGGVWNFADSTFIAGKGPSTLADPFEGAIIAPFYTFSWLPPELGADGYQLTVGTTPAARDVFDSGQTRATSVQVLGLDFGKTYYATLYTLKSNIWLSTSSTFRTFEQQSTPNLDQLASTFYSNVNQSTAAVRLMADPFSVAVVPGSPLESLLQQRGESSANCVDYALTLQQQLTQLGILSRVRNITLTGTSYEAHALLEYYDPFLKKWTIADPTFGIVYFDSATHTAQSVEDLQALVAANNFAGIHMQFLTSYGDRVLRSYYMDPITLFLNVFPPDGGPLAMQNSPSQFLQEVPIDSIVGTGGTYLFGFSNSADQLQLTFSGSSISLNPVDGTLFSRAIITADGWTLDVIPSGLKAYTFIRPAF